MPFVSIPGVSMPGVPMSYIVHIPACILAYTVSRLVVTVIDCFVLAGRKNVFFSHLPESVFFSFLLPIKQSGLLLTDVTEVDMAWR